jgi:cytochrome P450
MLTSDAERWIQYYWPLLDKINTFFSPKSTPLSKTYVLDRAQHTKPQESSLLHRLQAKSSQLSVVQVAAECMDHMAAGIDTTGDGLCFLMHELSLPRSQMFQKRLHEEIVQNPDLKLNNLPYLDAVIKEGLRLFPPIPMSLPRYVPREGSTISGYQLPGGSIVSCQAYSLHLLDQEVFPDADKFLPERWLEKEGEVERNRLFFAFASGGRGCIGKK